MSAEQPFRGAAEEAADVPVTDSDIEASESPPSQASDPDAGDLQPDDASDLVDTDPPDDV